MIVLSGADLVLPGGVQSGGTIAIDGDRIVDVRPGALGATGATGATLDLRGHFVLPGFIDVHVHGLEGIDVLDAGGAIARVSARLPKYGVTAFCPTTVACSPDTLRAVLKQVASIRSTGHTGARVLPAHLESNFINPEYNGAQPLEHLRLPVAGRDVLNEIDAGGDSVGIVTLAPELDGAIDLIRHLTSRGTRVSLGHSGATLEQARAGIEAGARHATHLFNRMPPLNHRDPGLAGAVLASDQIAAEIICDGVHVHPDMIRMAVAAKSPQRTMAITDGVAAAGMPEGSTASLGGRRICVRNSAAYLDDGTLAGSVTTMDRVFRLLVRDIGLSFADAARMCSTTPASEMGLQDLGTLTIGSLADLVVLDRELNVHQTYIAGKLVYSR